MKSKKPQAWLLRKGQAPLSARPGLSLTQGHCEKNAVRPARHTLQLLPARINRPLPKRPGRTGNGIKIALFHISIILSRTVKFFRLLKIEKNAAVKMAGNTDLFVE